MLRALKGVFRISLLMVLICLTACASNTRSMADSIRPHAEKFNDPACQRSFELAAMHDDIKLTRTIATPALLILTGGAYLLPLIGANMGLDALDHVDASHVSQVCGGFATPSKNILEKVFIGAGFGVLKK